MNVSFVRLQNGAIMPRIGLGTVNHDPKVDIGMVIKEAINAGYRHFDCAAIYGNEKEIGAAIKEKIQDGTVRREDLFITSKLWNNNHEPDEVVPACHLSRLNLGLEYLDLYLIHWPCGFKNYEHQGRGFPKDLEKYFTDVDYVKTWKQMENCVKLGLAKSIGLSNFNSEQIDRVLSSATLRPVVNQVEVHPNLNQKKLIAFCKERDIEIVAYCPLGSPARTYSKPTDPKVNLDHPDIINIGKKYGKSSAQVVLRYLLDIGVCPIPKSANADRLRANIDLFDFKLTNEEIATIDKFDCNGRICGIEEMKDHIYYPFNIEF